MDTGLDWLCLSTVIPAKWLPSAQTPSLPVPPHRAIRRVQGRVPAAAQGARRPHRPVRRGWPLPTRQGLSRARPAGFPCQRRAGAGRDLGGRTRGRRRGTLAPGCRARLTLPASPSWSVDTRGCWALPCAERDNGALIRVEFRVKSGKFAVLVVSGPNWDQIAKGPYGGSRGALPGSLRAPRRESSGVRRSCGCRSGGSAGGDSRSIQGTAL